MAKPFNFLIERYGGIAMLLLLSVLTAFVMQNSYVSQAVAAFSIIVFLIILIDLFRLRLQPRQTPDGQDDPDRERLEKERHWYLTSGLILISFGLTFSVFTNANVMFQGLLAEMERSSGVSFENTLSSLLVTLTITLLCWVTWYVVFHWGPRMRTSWAGFLSYVSAVFFTAVTIVVSSYQNFQGLTHTVTRPMYMVGESNRAAEIADKLTVVNGAAKAVIPGLKAIEADACALASAERDTGLASGTGSGFGPAASALTSVCSGMQGLIQALDKSVGTAEQKTTHLSAILEKLLRTVDDRKVPLLQREDRFRTAMAELDSVMRSFRNLGLGKAVKAGVGTLRNLVAKIDSSDPTNSNAKLVVNGLSQKLQGAAQDLEKVLDNQSELSTYKRSRKVSLTQISFMFGHQFPSQIAIAVFLDVWPLAIYSFGLLFSVRGRMPTQPIPKS